MSIADMLPGMTVNLPVVERKYNIRLVESSRTMCDPWLSPVHAISVFNAVNRLWPYDRFKIVKVGEDDTHFWCCGDCHARGE